jgi:hypothetical protein
MTDVLDQDIRPDKKKFEGRKESSWEVGSGPYWFILSSWGLLARVLAQDEEENEEAGKSRRLANEAEADVRPHHAKHKRKGQEFKERQSPADHSD